MDVQYLMDEVFNGFNIYYNTCRIWIPNLNVSKGNKKVTTDSSIEPRTRIRSIHGQVQLLLNFLRKDFFKATSTECKSHKSCRCFQ